MCPSSQGSTRSAGDAANHGCILDTQMPGVSTMVVPLFAAWFCRKYSSRLYWALRIKAAFGWAVVRGFELVRSFRVKVTMVAKRADAKCLGSDAVDRILHASCQEFEPCGTLLRSSCRSMYKPNNSTNGAVTA